MNKGLMSGPRVLVVDDSASTCLLIATALQQAGYEVDTALSGEAGLARVMTFHPHCLILDVLLPDLSGYALCRQIRQSPWGQKLPLILISCKDAPLDVSYGLRQGANRYLPKPFPAETLLQVVWEVLPEPIRQMVSPRVPIIAPQPTYPTPLDLIPRRALSQDAMQASNPFASVSALRDEQARRLYSAIDGKKTVLELASVTSLEAEEVMRILRLLLREHIIQIYTSAGQLLEYSL